MKKTTSATKFNNWTKQLSKLKCSKANFTIHNVAKGIKKGNNCACASIGILLVNLPITDINELAILVADIFADPIIGTPLLNFSHHVSKQLVQDIAKPMQKLTSAIILLASSLAQTMNPIIVLSI